MYTVMNSKQIQRQTMDKIRPFCNMSNTDIALIANVSPSLVSYVWAGVNRNQSVINTILLNLSDGWEDVVSHDEIEMLYDTIP